MSAAWMWLTLALMLQRLEQQQQQQLPQLPLPPQQLQLPQLPLQLQPPLLQLQQQLLLQQQQLLLQLPPQPPPQQQLLLQLPPRPPPQQHQLDAPTPVLTLTSPFLAPAPASMFPRTRPPKPTPSRLVSHLVQFLRPSAMPQSKTTSLPSLAARTPGLD